MTEMKRQKPRMNATIFCMVIEELMQGPTTRAELTEHTGMHRCTMDLIVRALHKRGLIHIAGWEADCRGGSTIAAFAFGPGKDAKKPPPKSKAQVIRNMRARNASHGAVLASAGVPIQPRA